MLFTFLGVGEGGDAGLVFEGGREEWVGGMKYAKFCCGRGTLEEEGKDIGRY